MIPDVVTIGDVNIDIITAPLSSNIVSQKDVEVPTKIYRTLGGNACNSAVALSQLNLKSRLIGALSDDPISLWLIDQLKGYNVEYHNAYKKVPAAITVALSYTDGTRTFISDFGSNSLFSLEDIDFKLIEGRHLHRAGFWWAPRLMGDGTKQLFQYARSKNMTTSLDIGWDPNDWNDQSRESIHKCLNFCDILFLNDKELEALTQTNLDDGAASLLQKGLQMIGLHYGEKGCKIYTKTTTIHIPSYKVEIKNPTGTGDVFNAGFIYGYLQKWSLENIGKFANAAAAVHLSSTRPFPPIEEVQKFFNLKEKE